MDWFTDLFIGNSVAHTIIIYAIVIAMGVILGKVRFFGISLGATFVLFCGILIGHLGVTVDGATLKFIQEFGLILFTDGLLYLQLQHWWRNRYDAGGGYSDPGGGHGACKEHTGRSVPSGQHIQRQYIPHVPPAAHIAYER